MKAVLCPICNGKGEVTPNWDSWDHRTLVKCHGCDGKGWVEITEGESQWKPYPGIYIHSGSDPDKCPACRSDRNNPPLAGCPKGSHYGTYCEV